MERKGLWERESEEWGEKERKKGEERRTMASLIKVSFVRKRESVRVGEILGLAERSAEKWKWGIC